MELQSVSDRARGYGLIVASLADSACAEILASSLSALGLPFRIGTVDNLAHEKSDANLLIGFATSIEAEHLKYLDRWCDIHAIQWLRCVVAPAEGFADAGPYFQPGRAERLANFDRAYLPRGEAMPEQLIPVSELESEFWTRLIAQPLIELCLGARTACPPNSFIRLKMDDFQSEKKRAIFLDETEESSPAAPFMVFEATVAYDAPVPNLAAMMTQNLSYVAGSLRPNEYPNSRMRPCSMPVPLGSASVSDLLVRGNEPQPPVSAEQMAALLLYSVGHQSRDLSQDTVRRFAGTAGNMGSCMLSYIMLESGTPSASISIYRPETHEEIQFNPHGLRRRANRLLSHLDRLDRVEAVFFLSSAIDRLQAKYGAFGYRLALMDTGVVLNQMSLVAQACGYHLQVTSQFSRLKTSRLLNIREDKTHLVSTAVLYRESHVSDTITRHQPNEENYCGLLRSPSPEMQAAALRHMALRSCSRSGVPGDRNLLARRGVGRLEQRSSLTNVLLNRRSVRRFSDLPVSVETLQTLLAMASYADQRAWACRPELQLSFNVLLRSGTHSTETIFRYDEQTASLKLVDATVDRQNSLLYVDARFQHAPAAVWISGNVAKVENSREYEELLIRAGASANCIWLLAIEQGLCGTIVAGILPEQASKTLALDGWREHPLCAIVLGFEA